MRKPKQTALTERGIWPAIRDWFDETGWGDFFIAAQTIREDHPVFKAALVESKSRFNFTDDLIAARHSRLALGYPLAIARPSLRSAVMSSPPPSPTKRGKSAALAHVRVLHAPLRVQDAPLRVVPIRHSRHFCRDDACFSYGNK